MNETRHSSDDSEQKPLSVWKTLGMVFGIFGVLIILMALIFDRPLPARKGRRTQAINNVKNVALAQKNYASQRNGFFAPPTDHLPDGTPAHGWVTQLLPLMDHASLYEQIDQRVPWNDARNQEFMKMEIGTVLIPELARKTDASGYGLTHFTLNNRLFPEGQSLTEDYVSRADGLGNTIMMGEIQEGLLPWGAPGNARDPALGLRPSPKTMGVDVHNGVTMIGFADGRATAVSNDIDPTVLKALATPDGGEEIPEEW